MTCRDVPVLLQLQVKVVIISFYKCNLQVETFGYLRAAHLGTILSINA